MQVKHSYTPEHLENTFCTIVEAKLECYHFNIIRYLFWTSENYILLFTVYIVFLNCY